MKLPNQPCENWGNPGATTNSDGILHLTIHGQPITAKNSQQIVIAGKRPCIVASKAAKAYFKEARQQLSMISYKPFDGPIEISAIYYMANARMPDLTNLMAATHDILEKAGVIVNDALIESVDGSRRGGIDRDNPRVEITIKKIRL
jgi:Holliday junction resolvase RusA-like endonuclease